jgi:molecular chaperone Hsp33
MQTLCSHEPGDVLVRTLSSDGSIAVRVMIATGLVGSAALRHATAPTATAALGRTLMGAVLMAAEAGKDETLQIQFRGDGPIGTVTVIADSEGGVRGFVGDPSADPPSRNGKLDVGRAIGRGILAVVRHHPSWREPYSGIVPLISGEVAEDLAGYLLESEQKPTAVALGVFVGSSGGVEAAGGLLVHALPGARPEALATLDANVRALPSPTQMLRAGIDADGIIDRVLAGLDSRDRHRSHPSFCCRCDRDRVLRAVTLLGREEIREISARGEALEVRCEFCAERYVVAADDVGSLLPSG